MGVKASHRPIFSMRFSTADGSSRPHASSAPRKPSRAANGNVTKPTSAVFFSGASATSKEM